MMIHTKTHRQQKSKGKKVKPRELIDFLNVIEKLKCNTRHSYTSSGRKESVAEHSWRLAVMAMLCKDEYPGLDIDRVIKMCLIHDFGEALTGDIPAFWKNEAHENVEDKATDNILAMLPKEYEAEFQALFDEMDALETEEAKLFKALDNMEAVISHNEADISTWIDLEYEENLRYGEENVQWSEWTKALKSEANKDSIDKINKAKS